MSFSIITSTADDSSKSTEINPHIIESTDKMNHLFKKIKDNLIVLNSCLIFDLIVLNNFKYLFENYLNYFVLIITVVKVIYVWAIVRNNNNATKLITNSMLTNTIHLSVFVIIMTTFSIHYLYYTRMLKYIEVQLDTTFIYHSIAIILMLFYSFINIFPSLINLFLLRKCRNILRDASTKSSNNNQIELNPKTNTNSTKKKDKSPSSNNIIYQEQVYESVITSS